MVAGLVASGLLRAQPPVAIVPGGSEEMVQLNFPQEIEVETLVEYVSERLQISIFYDEAISGKRITVRAPKKIPVSSLLNLLQSALRMKNLALVDAGTPNWYRIVEANQLTDVAEVGLANAPNNAVAITETFVLQHIDIQQVDQIVKPFLTQPGANSVIVPGENLLIVTDYAGNLYRIRELIKSLDRPDAKLITEFYTVQNLAADEITKTVTQILTASSSGDGQGRIQLLPDQRTNQIALVGLEQDVADAKVLLERFDVALGLQTFVYQFGNVSADRVNTIFQELIDPLQRETLYQATVDAEANLLIVRTTEQLHQRLERLQKQLDVAPSRSRSPVRFVRLKNANVNEVLQTLRDIGEAQSQEAAETQTSAAGDGEATPNAALPVSPLYTNPLVGAIPVQPLPLPLIPDDGSSIYSDNESPIRRSSGGANLPGGVRVSGDPLTNSVVLVGNPAAQAAYLELIEQLDLRRPQVMIEAHIVAIDTSNNFSLGVEISGGDRSGSRRLFSFTSFGLSEVDPVTGALQIIPNIGFNGTLVDPEVADAVVQALASNTHAHVLASPKILVNDNTRGRLENVLSIPFQSVNASQTVSTTSLGGNQQAGTTIDVTPHIKQNNELELQFSVEFSSFAGDGNAALPPPRQISSTESTVTIPDGHTVIVGGLKQVSTAETYAGVPYLEKIPLIRTLTGLQTETLQTTSFFLFIKPIVIRDDQFVGLKHLSAKDIERSGAPARFPKSAPLMYRCHEHADTPHTDTWQTPSQVDINSVIDNTESVLIDPISDRSK